MAVARRRARDKICFASPAATNAANDDSPMPAVTTVSYNVVGNLKWLRKRGNTSLSINPSIS